MRKNIQQVIDAFREGRKAYGVTCSTDGKTIWSYRMPIAQRRGKKIEVIAYESGPTRTTKSQIAACHSLLAEEWTGDEWKLRSGVKLVAKIPGAQDYYPSIGEHGSARHVRPNPGGV